MMFKKIILVFLGSASLVVGVLAAFIPGLPTTPFLLLAAWLYLKSSKRLHEKLLRNKFLGGFIRDFHENKGMKKRIKIQAIGTMWIMVLISSIFMIEILGLKIIVIMLGVIGTVVMGFIVPTTDEVNKKK